MRTVMALVLLCGCVSEMPAPSYEALFTLPYARGEEMTVWDRDEGSVELASGTYVDLRAPQHSEVLEVRVGAIVLRHANRDAVLVADDVDVIWAREGDQLCAGDSLGRTRQMRLRAFWGREEFAEQADLSVVKTKRHDLIEYLSDARSGDRLQSVLRIEGGMERSSDINQGHCPYSEEMEE